MCGRTDRPLLPDLRDESGQAIVEYVLGLALILALFLIVKNGVSGLNLSAQSSKALEGNFARAYRYGHVKAKGFDHGEPYNQNGPEYHPRVAPDAVPGNFRIFYNPGKK